MNEETTVQVDVLPEVAAPAVVPEATPEVCEVVQVTEDVGTEEAFV